MKAFNLFSLCIFVMLAALTFVGGFYNWIHWVLCAISVKMAVIALLDDPDGNGSLLNYLREMCLKE